MNSVKSVILASLLALTPYPCEMMNSVKSVILANVLALPPTPVK